MKKLAVLLVVSMVFTSILAACGATPEPQVIKETVVVTEKETVKETVVVTEKSAVKVKSQFERHNGL